LIVLWENEFKIEGFFDLAEATLEFDVIRIRAVALIRWKNPAAEALAYHATGD